MSDLREFRLTEKCMEMEKRIEMQSQILEALLRRIEKLEVILCEGKP